MSPFRTFCLCLALCGPARSEAQAPRPVEAPHPLVVMNLAAHPDDEDGRTLTYYRHARHAVAYSVIYTRGEGGQNEIGSELYQALGALRTRETERAARLLGTQVHFLNFYDFGYSKRADEAFEKWGGRDFVTARIVYMIRKYKPDVLFTNHDTVTVGPRRQHGQHQAVGLSGYDAFHLAADPSYHPEQLDEDGVDLWQPKRFFWRRFQDTGDHDVALPIGTVDPETGAPYYAPAVAAIQEHASQGMGLFADRLKGPVTYYKLIRSATDAPLDATDLAGNLPPNAAARPDLSYLIDAGYAPALPEGVLTGVPPFAVPGQRFEFQWDSGKMPGRRLRWRFSGAVDTTLYLSDDAPGIATLRLLPDAAPTLPKALRQYDRFQNHPPVVYALYRAGSDTLLAAGYLPLEVAPPLVVQTPHTVMRLKPGDNPLPVQAHIYDPALAHVTLRAAVTRNEDGAAIFLNQTDLAAADTVRASVNLTLPANLAPGEYTVTLTALGAPTTRPPEPVHTTLQGRVFDVRAAPGLRVGVVQSYDNTLGQALDELGVDYVMLDSLALATGTFDDLDTILIDIRAYLVRPDLRRYNDRLLAWVERGGHLVVNYQKTFEWNEEYDDPFDPARKNPGTFAPYPLRLSRDRVTREDAPVEILRPTSPLFHAPNPIGEATWAGWVQERGLYFPREYDARYEELFRMADPGEPPLEGSTLLAHYGKGTYLYTALVWYRQLKVYHPGVYAFFANLISLPRVDERAPAGTTDH